MISITFNMIDDMINIMMVMKVPRPPPVELFTVVLLIVCDNHGCRMDDLN